MDALAREIGSRGRGHMEVSNDAVRMPRVVEDDPTAPSDAQVTLRTQLQNLRLKQLRRRAGAEGLDEDSIDDALDSDNPKASLIDLVIDRLVSRGPAECVLSTLQVGGDGSTELLCGVLDHAMDVLEQVSISSPRKAR